MKSFSACMLVAAGCAMVSMALIRSRLMWLGLGFPLIALGLSMSGLRFSPITWLEVSHRWIGERARDLRAIRMLLREAPASFRFWRDQV